MLTLILPADIGSRLKQALVRAGTGEVGGILMAEHTRENEFTVRDVTIHKRGGFASFVRLIEEALSNLNIFFERTQKNYTRFNYIGEWHSHPSFSPVPSQQDHISMYEIITDPSVAANFVVLVILKLDSERSLIGTVHLYLPDGMVKKSKLIIQ